MNIFEDKHLLLEFEKQTIEGIPGIFMDSMEILDTKPTISKGVVKFKAEFKFSFKNPKGNDFKQSDVTEMKESIRKKSFYKSKKLHDVIFKFATEEKSLINENNKKEKDMFEISLEDISEFDVVTTLNPQNNWYYTKFPAWVTFDMGKWWAESIIDGRTDKAFFFKNYKIKYKWNVNNLIKKNLPKWKEQSIDILRRSLFENSKLKNYMRELTRLEMNKDKIDFEITFNDAQNEIKLILLRGMVKWLAKFGISGFWAKWILTGISIFGILKLLKNKDKDQWKEAHGKLNKFLD